MHLAAALRLFKITEYVPVAVSEFKKNYEPLKLKYMVAETRRDAAGGAAAVDSATVAAASTSLGRTSAHASA